MYLGAYTSKGREGEGRVWEVEEGSKFVFYLRKKKREVVAYVANNATWRLLAAGAQSNCLGCFR